MGSLKWLVLAGVTIWAAVWMLPDNQLHVVFCDVGQGDAILISRGTDQLLVDGGPDDKVIGCLSEHMPFYDRRIETVVLTHDDSDHSRGMSYVRDRYSVIYYETDLVRGDIVKVGGFEYRVEWPAENVINTKNDQEDNSQATVGRIEYGQFSLLLTSDTPTKLYQPETGIEVVKVPHHGSKTDFDAGWWRQARPALAVVSVGKNSYGHPVPEVMKSLNDLGIRILRTDQEGDIEIVSDGLKWWVK